MRRWLAVAIGLAACGGGSPEISDLADQVAVVGTELVVEIDGSDPEGDQLTYGVHADISLQGRAMMTQSPSGMGIFRWTPLAEDIGVHAFDFTADDGSNTTTVSIQIEVRSAVGSAPIFRRPLGTGTSANPTQCLTLEILVEDNDTAQVDIVEEAPPIMGATLDIVDGTSGTWTWCPTPAQVAAADRYTLVLSADDGDNPKTIKNYVIALGTSGPKLVLNEVDYDQANTDGTEYIEILNGSSSTTSLAGYQVVLVNGSGNTIYDTIDLSSVGSLMAGQYVVIAGASVTVPASAKKLNPVWSTDQIQNGAPDGIALIDGATHTLVDALSYEGAITSVMIPDFPAPVSLVEGTAIPAATADLNTTAARTFCRFPNGQDTNDAATDWKTCGTLTRGTANVQ